MKRLIGVSAILLCFLLSGFDSDETFYEYMPVFMKRSEMENSIRLESPRGIQNPGKIYVKGQYVLINEKYRGIHLIDNTNPESPDNVGFIHVDGCIDIVVKDNVIYADNAVDLIAIRVNSGMTGIEVTERVKNTFPELIAPDGRSLTYREKIARPDNSILVRWEKQ